MRILPLLALAAVLASPLAAQDTDGAPLAKDLLEMEHCHLTLDSLKRYYSAEADLSALARTNPALATKLAGEPNSIDVNARMFQSEPALVALLARHGFTPRQFTVVRFTTVQTIFALIAKQEGSPPGVLAGLRVDPANIALFEQHSREIETFQKPKAPEHP